MGTNTQILSTSWDACPRQVTHFVYFDCKQTLSQQLSSQEDDDGVSLFLRNYRKHRATAKRIGRLNNQKIKETMNPSPETMELRARTNE